MDLDLGRALLSDIIVYSKYARFLPVENRRETWQELVDRTRLMHTKKYQELLSEINNAFEFVYNKEVLPSMRSLQFGGKAIERNNTRIYNCSYLPINDWEAFHELMFLLLSGCGVGYSVQNHHIETLQEVTKPTKHKRFLIQDSIIGWADSIKALMKAYFLGKAKPIFDFSDIREKGLPLKTSGGIAPGPEPLKDCLHNLEKVLDRKTPGSKLTALEAHDLACYIADCVLAGGIRRAAMIGLFSLDDETMLTSKFGNWFELNAQRARANNSAVILRHRVGEKDFFELWDKMRYSNSGEPGFMMSNDQNYGTNPCGEIALRPFEFCNLVEVNVTSVKSQNDLNERVKAASLIATLQAGYTNFHYLRDIWQKTTEKDALIGVSLTGIASKSLETLDLKEAAKLVKEENARVAKLIGINPAARCTTVKPSGTASLVLGSSSGIHAWHAPYYVRRVRVNKLEPIYQYLLRKIPELLEDDYFKPNTEAIIAVPIKAPKGAITREESAIQLLERVQSIYNNWIVPGHRAGHNRNNVSTTVTVKADEWDQVKKWMWENRDTYGALSILPEDLGSYKQPPFEEINKSKYDELVQHLCKIDLTEVHEYEDSTKRQAEVACGGGACEVSYA